MSNLIETVFKKIKKRESEGFEIVLIDESKPSLYLNFLSMKTKDIGCNKLVLTGKGKSVLSNALNDNIDNLATITEVLSSNNLERKEYTLIFESNMLDIITFNKLLDIIPNDSNIAIIGDSRQISLIDNNIFDVYSKHKIRTILDRPFTKNQNSAYVIIDECKMVDSDLLDSLITVHPSSNVMLGGDCKSTKKR